MNPPAHKPPRVNPQPEDDGSPSQVPLLPSYHRREITAFVVLVLAVGSVCYLLARVPRFETLSLYVLGLGIPLGLLVLRLFRRVRCPRCKTQLEANRKVAIEARSWLVFRCARCRGEWRLREEHPPP